MDHVLPSQQPDAPAASPDPAVRPAEAGASDELEALLKVRFSRRRDLRFTQLDSPKHEATSPIGQARWNVLDPISRQSFRIGWVEHWILTRIETRRTLGEIAAQFHEENPSIPLADHRLLTIVNNFCAHGLIRTSEKRADSESVLLRTQSALSSLVVWQIRGIQPDRWLAWLAPHTSFLFSSRAVQFWLAAALLTFGAVLLEFQRLLSQSQNWTWQLSPTTGGMLMVVFVLTRALHELGHALACKRFGVRCPDIGVFLILGAPCVYCDVSESWQLSRRWQRAAVAAAGMYVELVVATLAAWGWLLTIDGAVNTLALQTMFVCSVSTVLINANPLMRFDGYYILADWLDETNLRAKADQVATAWLQRMVLGGGSTEEPLLVTPGRRRFLLILSIAGWIYRALLSVTIATVVIALYSSWNLVWIGRFLAVAVLVSWWGVPMVKTFKNLYRRASQSGRRWRLAIFAAGLVLIVAWLPIPSRQFASGWLQPRQMQGVFASTPARLVRCHTEDGQQVEAGKPLFELQSTALAVRQIERRRGVDAALARRNAQRRSRDMHGQDVDLSPFESDVHAAKVLARNAQRDIDGLTLISATDGRFVANLAAPPGGPLRDSVANQAATWCDPGQIGRTLPEGTLLGTVCSSRAIAVIPLSEDQLAQIAAGTEVHLHVPQQPAAVASTRVDSIVQVDEVIPLRQGDQLSWPSQHAPASSLTTATAAGQVPPARFAAVVDLPDALDGLPGATIHAVFVTRSRTLATLMFGWLKSNLRLFASCKLNPAR